MFLKVQNLRARNDNQGRCRLTLSLLQSVIHTSKTDVNISATVFADPCCSVSGIGAGTKDFDKHPNILRVILGEVPAPPLAQEPQPIHASVPSDGAGETGDWIARQLWVLEANIDDMTGEAAGYLTEKLLEVPKCLDAWLSPILMKKGRPAFTVHVLCEPQDQEQFIRVLFTESTTLGVRRRSVERCALRRKTVSTSTTFGDVRVKAGVIFCRWRAGVSYDIPGFIGVLCFDWICASGH